MTSAPHVHSSGDAALSHGGPDPDPRARSREIRELFLPLRPAIRDLYASYGIPRRIGTAYFREAAELTALRCHRLPDPRRYFLDRLETRCRAHWRAVMELDGDLQEAPEDAEPLER